ncbi:MAG: tripartite tricarboxylate transporter substrate binding protein [Candidatus Rokubacteria bacterium]|nr:tripartite tricarboxylate transporter substrate binding protein [Candidatus Rokubacteria bacterium]MBI4255095.1 tripartite tricarboxylate transporter substrate binding protein [Candidatus Rokubacteria bacterium]
MMRLLSAAAMVVLALAASAGAQEPYPTRPITIVVAFPPGGLADLTARPLAAALERLLKQPVVVSNKPGAAGAVGNQFTATSKPDGYTLLMALVSVSTLPEVDKLFGRPHNYTIDQFTGVARINAEPSVITVRGDAPWKTLADLVEDAKRRPNQIVHTSSGLYGASHVPFAMFLQAAGLTMRHLPTTGGGPMMNALLGAHADIVASVPSLVAPHLPTGKVRLLAHSGVGRLPAYPDLPSLKELGYDVEYAAWAGLVAPRGTPAHILKILGDAVRQGVKEPEVVTASQKLQTPVAYQDAGEFNAWWKKDAEKLAAVIKKIGKLEGAR